MAESCGNIYLCACTSITVTASGHVLSPLDLELEVRLSFQNQQICTLKV